MNLSLNPAGPPLLERSIAELPAGAVTVAEEGRAKDPLDVAQSFIDLCQNGHSPTSLLTARFEAAIRAFGFRYFACCAHVDPLHPPSQAMMLHNYPVSWIQRVSDKRLYRIDPVWQRAERDPVPFFWDTAFQSNPITPAQRNFLAEAADFGLVHGYTVPIHLSWLPGAVRTSCSVVPDPSTVSPHNYCMVDTIATLLYSALTRARPSMRASAKIELSRRERQCLILAAKGKDDWAIGQLLGLSPKTVHSYFKRLMERLGVSTRVQAIVWALETGQMYTTEDPALFSFAHTLRQHTK